MTDILESELNGDAVCEALGCFEKVTTIMKVPIGHKGTVRLLLCNKCVRKFETNVNKKGEALDGVVGTSLTNASQNIQSPSMEVDTKEDD